MGFKDVSKLIYFTLFSIIKPSISQGTVRLSNKEHENGLITEEKTGSVIQWH